MARYLFVLLLLTAIFPTLLFAGIPGIEIKGVLERELKTTYLQSLEQKYKYYVQSNKPATKRIIHIDLLQQ